MGVRLTRREVQVLDGCKQHLQNKEIADNLALSERTVKFHVSSILAKANVKSRYDLTNWEPEAVTVPIKLSFQYLYRSLSDQDRTILEYVGCDLNIKDVQKQLGIKIDENRITLIAYALGLTRDKLGYDFNLKTEIIRFMNFYRLITAAKSEECDRIRKGENPKNDTSWQIEQHNKRRKYEEHFQALPAEESGTINLPGNDSHGIHGRC